MDFVGAKRPSRVPWLLLGLLPLLVAAGVAVYVGKRVGGAPELVVTPSLPGIGAKTTIRVEAAEPVRGLVRLELSLLQGDKVFPLAERDYEPQPAHEPWGPKTERDELEVVVGRETVPGLVQGQATLRVVAGIAGTWLRSVEPKVVTLELPVRFTPPPIAVRSSQTYVAQGGAEAVVYTVGDTAVRHGVQAGAWFFPGYPLAGSGERSFFSIFAVPYDMADATEIKLVAEDELGNTSSRSFIDSFKARPFKTDTINVSDRFLETVVPQILAESPGFVDEGSLLDNYLAINGEMRRANDATLKTLSEKSEARFHWNKPFMQMPGKVFSAFADRRTYKYQEREIDQQFHLGFDIASTQKALVPAANDGKVLFAGHLGIYGQAVVLDHGHGLLSLYGHLSSIAVKEGQAVTRGQPVGNTGDTGLALGDHLHFTMLLHGLAVTPMEWWDGHWIRDRIALKLGPALPLEPE